MYMGLDWKQGDCPLCAEQRIGAARERGRIVAWLLTEKHEMGSLVACEAIEWCAESIERGAHLEQS